MENLISSYGKENLKLVSSQLQFDDKGIYLIGQDEQQKNHKVYIEDFKKLPFEWDKKELAFMAKQNLSDETNFTWILTAASALLGWVTLVGILLISC